MMREILFRGKAAHTIDHEWLYGYVCAAPWEPEGIMIVCATEDGRVGGETAIPETVGQFTGLVDKNGKKIFEGDILGYFNEYQGKRGGLCVVKYGKFNCSCCDGVYGWYLDNGDIRYLEDPDYIEYEVIGNIHDNPEFLEGIE